jgi:hypothetical protein
MLWEVILLIVSVTLLCFYSLLQDLVRYLRNRKRALVLSQELGKLDGQPAWEAEKRFGPPTEVVSGTSGRQLYIWKLLALPGIPKAGGLMVVTLTIDPDGAISGTHWQKRGD